MVWTIHIFFCDECLLHATMDEWDQGCNFISYCIHLLVTHIFVRDIGILTVNNNSSDINGKESGEVLLIL